ncbi:MAG: hypothetical protein ACSHX8_08380 [Opitutaceae bacterium]
MHLLTTDRLTKSQLSLILRDLGHSPEFHNSFNELTKGLDANVGSSHILIDLRFELSVLELETLKSKYPTASHIGFERYDTSLETAKRIDASNFSTSIVIPSHSERAKMRLKNALRGTSGVNRKVLPSTTRPSFSFKRKVTQPPFQKTKNRADSRASDTVSSRYLTTKSLTSVRFMETLKAECAEKNSFVIFSAEETVEFELVARELNYQMNRDSCPLHIVSSEELRLDNLEKLERKASKSRTRINCYIGPSEDLDQCAASEVKLFIEYLGNLRNPHARLIMAHEHGSASLFQAGVEEHFASLRQKAKEIEIPRLAERIEDIPEICQQTLGFLRSAHPFLVVTRISNEVERYLLEHRELYSYTKLVRILRNAISLCQRESLSVEDIKNYGESDMTTQHLLETMADETYFPQSANF